MAYLNNNSTNLLIDAGKSYIGTGVQLTDAEFTSVQCSFNVAGGGTGSWKLMFMHSFDGITYESYGDEYEYTINGSYSRSVLLKAKYFHIRFENNKTQNLTNFHLYCKLSLNLNDDLNVNIDSRYDSISVVAGGTGLNTRLLTTSDEITIPSLDNCITGNNIGVVINGGSLVIGSDSNIHASNGDILTATSGSLNTNITNFSSLTLSSTTSSITIPSLTSAKDSVTVSGTVSLSSGSSVSVSNQITGYATSALQTTGNNILTDIKNKTINKTTDSIDITNQNINVNPRIESSNYDLLLQGSTLWADSTPIDNPFNADENGREGWYYFNSSNIANKSNIYWYANPPTGTPGNLQENDMTFLQLSNMYSVFTCDYVDNGELTVPFLSLYSQPTGTNDFIPTFAHSRWVYQLSNTNLSKLRKGETILIYTGSSRPSVFNELASYQLNLVSQNGDASPTEIIAYMTINTQATTSRIGYLLQFCGYFNSAIGFNKQYGFQNSKNRVIQNKLYNGLATEKTVQDIRNTTEKITFSGNDLNVKVSNPTGITGYALQSTLADIEYRTNLLSFFNESGINELMVYDESNESNLIDIKNILNNGIGISGSVTIDNFQAGVTNVYIQNYPSLQGITGSVSVSNFPASQTINGTVTVDNFAAGVTNVYIQNYPSLQGITGSISVSNFPATQTINGTVTVDNFAAGVTNVYIQNYPSLQGITGSISVSNFPATQTINGTVTIDNFEAGVTNVYIQNYPSLQGITGSVSVSNFPASQTINGTVTVNTISGFALETGGNLASIKTNTDSIKTNTDKFKFTGDNLKTTITNSALIVETGTNPLVVQTGVNSLDVNVTGGNLPADGKAYLYSGNGVTPITQTTISSKSGIDSNIINSSIDVHNKVLHNSTWVDLVGASNGHLIVNSSTQDGNGTDITSTLNGSKQSLDVNVSNISAIPVSGTVSLSSGSVIKISDGVDTANVVQINTAMLASQEKGLATVSAVYGAVFTPGGSLTSSQPITMTNITEAVIDGKNALDTYDFRVDAKLTTVNTKLDTINTSVGTTNTTLTSTNTKLDTINTSVGTTNTTLTSTNTKLDTINTSVGTVNTSIGTTNTTLTSTNTKLDTINTSVGTTNSTLTTTNTTLSAISSKMVTQSNSVSGGATVGLNVYNIYPNKLIYRMAGSASAPVSGQFLGPEALAFDGNSFNIGLNYATNFNIYLTSAGTRSVDLDYIDANGNRALTTISINNTDQVRLSSAVNINSMNWTPVLENVDTRLRAIARTAVYRNQLSTFISGSGVITVPNGYVGIVSNLYYNSANGDDLIMVVKDKYNNVKTTRYMAGVVGTATGRYFNIGDINEPLIAGDSVYFLSALSGSGQKYIHAIVTLEAL
jgi:hypothetical protein